MQTDHSVNNARNTFSPESAVANDNQIPGPSARFDKYRSERPSAGCSIRQIPRVSNNTATQKLIELRITGLPIALKNEGIVRSIAAEPLNEVNSEITFLSHYSSRYQNSNTKTIIIKLKFESAKAILERGTAIINTYNYKCTRIVRLKQCTKCLMYTHTSSECENPPKKTGMHKR